MIEIRHGDCIVTMRAMDDACVDAIVTDPPYELGFMGKGWDATGIANSVEMWREAYRVLKPGGHMLAFSGTRTYHRMVCAIEDAGFEIRDQIGWMYGSGMPKAFNLKRAGICDCEDSGNTVPYDHGKSHPKHDLRPLRHADVQAPQYADDQRREVLFSGMPQQSASELGCAGTEPEPCRGEQPGMEGRLIHRAGEGLSHDPHAGASEGAGQRVCVGAHLGGGADVGTRSEPGRGSASHQPGSCGQSAGEPEGVQGSHGTLDVGALRGRGACPRCGQLRKEFEGFSTSLKPAWEPICVARKPLSEKTVAANVLAHGTGAINIDGCRVATDDNLNGGAYSGGSKQQEDATSFYTGTSAGVYVQPAGRWPANVIHDGSDEVLEAFAAFVERKCSGANPGLVRHKGGGVIYGECDGGQPKVQHNDTGTAARFFYSAKASKADRAGSKHPTVKNLSLMRYLCKLVTPPGGTVLDPFAGSGTTLQAALEEGFSAIGIEQDATYVNDIRTRIDAAREGLGLFAVAAE